MLLGGLIALGIGVLLTLIFRLWYIVKAFQESVLWGIVVLLVPLGDVIFLALRPAVAWRPFLAQIVALVIAGAGAWVAFQNGADADWVKERLALERAPVAEPGLMEKREKVMVLENKVANDAAKLQASYTELNATFSKLNKTDPAAVAAYNAQAKTYQEQKTALDTLRADLARRQADLQQNIDQGGQAKTAVSTGPSVPSLPAPRQPAAAGSSGEIIVFIKKGAPAVTMARAYLSGRRLTYREIDVDASEENRKEWNRYGTVIPTFVINGQVVSGFVREELDRLIPTEDPPDAF